MSSDPPKPPTTPTSPTPHTPYVSPSPYQTTIESSDPHQPHHIAEFGEVNTAQIQHHDPHQEEEIPVPPRQPGNTRALRERTSRLTKRLFAERHLQQYFHNDILYRSPHTRTIGPDELFLDLVIVGGIAALGHELRVTFGGWEQFEKFFLLFAAIHSGWRATIMVWNMWGVVSDLFDKIAIYLVFTMLIFISIGAHNAFDDGVRPYVAIASFLATAIPCFSMISLSLKEPLLKNPNNRVNQLVLMSSLVLITVLPYFAAAFVPSERATRILYWTALGLAFFPTLIAGNLYIYLHRKRTGYTRLAVAIELMVEKYDVLTMIVLGESVLSILFEGSELISQEGVRLSSLFGAAAASTAMLYSLQTLYVNVDAVIAKGGKHAIRYKARNGILWGLLHMLYHASLILFAVGLGISMRDIALSPVDNAAEEVARIVVRAGGSSAAAGGERFGTRERRLFSNGWGSALIFSALISAMHLAGPRAATKKWRCIIRTIIAVGVMTGLPFTNLSAEHYVGIHTGILVVIAVVEYICVQMDRLGFFRSEFALSSTKGTSTPARSDVLEEEIDASDDTPTSPEESGAGLPESSSPDALTRALTARMCRGHSNRLVVCRKSLRDRAMSNDQKTEP